MSVARQNADNRMLNVAPEPIAIDRFRTTTHTTAVTQAAAVGAMGTVVVMRASTQSGAAVAAMGSSFVGVTRSPLVQMPAPAEPRTASRRCELRIMPRTAATENLAGQKDRELRWMTGVQIALILEAAAALCLYGVWHLWQLIR